MYVNGLLTPDIYLERGVRHTLLVETGAGDLGNYQDFHPIYITSDSSGGHQLKPDLEAKVSLLGVKLEMNLKFINQYDLLHPTLSIFYRLKKSLLGLKEIEKGFLSLLHSGVFVVGGVPDLL